MRQRLCMIGCAFLAALLLAGTGPGQVQADTRQRLRLAAEHPGSFEVVPVSRLMRAVKRANLRSGPGTHHNKVGLLEVGEQVRVTGKAGGWLRVDVSDGKTAFVYAPLLGDVTPSAEPTAAERLFWQSVKDSGDAADLRAYLDRYPQGTYAALARNWLGRLQAQGRASDGSRPVRSVEAAHRAVWKIHNLKPGETFGKRKDHSRGTAFAIGPRNFIINVAHDLALLETGQRVEEYLRFSDKDAPSPGEQLWVMGYLDGFTRQEVANGIVYEDIFTFAVATDFPDLAGMSGSPILDAGGRVAGVGYFAEGNMLYGVKINHQYFGQNLGRPVSDRAIVTKVLVIGAGFFQATPLG